MPLKFTAPPELTTTWVTGRPAMKAPRAFLLPMTRVPALTVLVPVWVFAPERVWVPDPDLVRERVAPLAPPLERMPEKVWLPAVSTTRTEATLVTPSWLMTVPEPARPPTVSELLPLASLRVPLTVSRAASGM